MIRLILKGVIYVLTALHDRLELRYQRKQFLKNRPDCPVVPIRRVK